MYEVHSGVCDAHQSGPKMRVKLKQMGYYWPTMVQNCMDYVKHCNICQIYGDYMPNPLRPTVASWPIFLLCASTKLTCRAYEKENLFLNHTPLAPVPWLKKKAIVAASPYLTTKAMISFLLPRNKTTNATLKTRLCLLSAS